MIKRKPKFTDIQKNSKNRIISPQLRVDSKKVSMESMSKEELISKYKGLLGIARQAKKSKDEFAEENQKIREQLTNCETQRDADKKSLLTMKEMLEEFTQNKLEMASEINELRGINIVLAKKETTARGDVEKLSIENESLRRQVNRLTEDNESLLDDIDQMEKQLQQVNVLGKKQKEHLDLLELEVEKLKEYELTSRMHEAKLQSLIKENESLRVSTNESKVENDTLSKKYQSLKEISADQRANFRNLKERFIELHKKLKQLQDCKRILVASHHEYADSITKWQQEITHASEQLCDHIQNLTKENIKLKEEFSVQNGDSGIVLPQLPVLIEYCEKALVEYRLQTKVNEALQKENENLKSMLESQVKEKNPNTGDMGITISDTVDSSAIPNEKTKTAPETSDDKASQIDIERITEEAIASEIDFLKSENSRLKTDLSTAKKEETEKVNNFKAENSRIVHDNEALQAESVQLKAEYEKLMNDTVNLMSKIANLEQEAIVIKQAAFESQSTEIITLQQSNQNLQGELEALKTSTSMVNALIASRLPELINCCDRALVEHQQQSNHLDNLSETNKDLNARDQSAECDLLRVSNSNLQTELTNTKLDSQVQFQLTERLDHLKTENTKLKNELVSYKQKETEVQDVLRLRNNLVGTTQLCEDLQNKLEKQERENTDLLNEMRELNEALKGRGDVISRQQEKHQELVAEMKKTSTALSKIENDLRSKDAIIKEKEMRISKISDDNHAALREVNRLQNLSREHEIRVKTLSDEIATMRVQIENSETQSEALSTSTISRAEELTRLRDVDESFEEKYNKLRGLAIKLKKKVHEQTLYIADLEKQSADSKAKLTETSERLTAIENERESLQKELKTCKTQVESLKGEVDKLKSSKKQSNVLTLEIEAFEKSLNETSAKLSSKTAEYELLKETLLSKDSAIDVMRKEIKILEDSQESEKEHSIELKKQIDKLQDQLKDAIHGKQEVSAKFQECLAENQSIQSELAEANQRLTQTIDRNNAERIKLVNEKENLLGTISSLKDELHAVNNRVSLAEQSFQELHQEYSNYKVKAQSVLRQNQSKESSKERELEEELSLLKDEHKHLSNRFETLLEKYQTTEKTIEELQDENRRLQIRNSELINTISNIRKQVDVLSQENKHHLETYQETLKGHRLQIEALSSCHQQQMLDIQAKYDQEITELKATQKRDSDALVQKSLDRIDYVLMEREDAEGSEAETTHQQKYLPSTKRSAHDLIPLDELLSSSTIESSYAVLDDTRSISPTIELQETKERLHKQESRMRHLTSLLAESEQDLARLTQLNEMLKEEVRRQERTVEREKHMHNSEYLKNIVLKFVCLNSGDERTRLVPVLNTILKLSPSEMEMLQNVAKGKAENSNRSWGNLLSHWGTS